MNQEYKSFSAPVEEKEEEQVEKEQLPNSSPQKLKNKKGFFLFILILIIFLGLVGIGFILFNSEDYNLLNKDSQGEIEYLSNLSSDQLNEINKEENQRFLKSRKEHCQGISNEKMRNDCLERIKIDQVLILEDDDLCSNIDETDEQKNICFSRLAESKDDLNICEKINDQKIKDDCKDQVYFSRIRKNQEEGKESDIELCEKIKGEFMREMCLEEFLMTAKNISVCNSDFILTENWQDKCQSIVLLNQAVKQEDTLICQQIPLADYQNNCVKIIERRKNLTN